MILSCLHRSVKSAAPPFQQSLKLQPENDLLKGGAADLADLCKQESVTGPAAEMLAAVAARLFHEALLVSSDLKE